MTIDSTYLRPMEKTCSKCNAPFTCQNETRGCWCEGLTLSPETLTSLRQAYDNCLCPACLKGYEAAQHPAAEAADCHTLTP
jgi:hypothetical protein